MEEYRSNTEYNTKLDRVIKVIKYKLNGKQIIIKSIINNLKFLYTM